MRPAFFLLAAAISASPASARDVVMKDDFTWDYEQDYQTCHYGVAPGVDFCGYDRGWRILFDRSPSGPPIFALRDGEHQPNLRAFFDQSIYPHGPLATSGLTVVDFVSDQIGLDPFSLFVVDEADTVVSGHPAKTFVIEAEAEGAVGFFLAVTLWDIPAKVGPAMNQKTFRTAFMISSAPPTDGETLSRIMTEALPLIQEFNE